VRIAGKTLTPSAYQVGASSLTLPRVPAGPFELDLVTFSNPQGNKALQGLYLSRGVYCTQCEAQGFRRITYFLDRPDVLATYTTRIEADKSEAPVLLSNGNLVVGGDMPNGRCYAIWHDPHPKPSYLFALVGGKLGYIEDRFLKIGRA